MYYYDPTYFLLIPGLLLALYAQFKVNSTFNRFKQVPSRVRMTGAEIARAILDDNGCRNVCIEPVAGSLTDHYDPQNGVLRLSREVYGSHSIAALGVAAHEAGHAFRTRRTMRRCASARIWCRWPISVPAWRCRCLCWA